MLQNVSGRERVFSLLAGGLALNSALRSSHSGLLSTSLASVGLGLLFRGSSGHCPIYKKLDFNSQNNFDTSDAKPENSILVNKTMAEVASFLHASTLPFGSFFPAQEANAFSARIGADLWTLRLSEHLDGKRTFIKRSLEVDPLKPTLASGKQWAKATLAKLPIDAAFDLRKLRALIETGELATIKGQPHGERSSLGKLIGSFKQQLTLPEPEKNTETFQNLAGLKGASL